MPFPEPQHSGHVFLGYRGVSIKHYLIDPGTKAIKYNPPPPGVTGAAQLGAGVYIVNNLRTAADYAKDSAWNCYCNNFKNKNVDDDKARLSFEHNTWKNWGRIHAVFMPEQKYHSQYSEILDFSHVNIDKTGDFIWDNMRNSYNLYNKSRTSISRASGLKTQLFDDIQTIIYPPHTGALFIKDITEEAAKYLDSD